MNIKEWKVDFFGGKYFPSILIIFEFDLIIARARVKERNSIHSRMIERKTYREDVGELSRNSTLLFPGTGKGRKIWRAHRLRDPLPLSRAGDFACTGRNGPEGTEARTNSCDRDWIARKSYPPTPRIAFISDFGHSSSLRSCRQLSLSLLCNAFIFYIYIFYTEERLNSGGFYIR